MTIHVRYDGDGELHETDTEASKVNGHVAHGGTFETTQKRFDELRSQGVALTKLKTPDDAVKTPVVPGKESN